MNRHYSLLILITLAAFALRAHALGAKSLWYDELRQVEVAQHPLAEFPDALARHAARPLDYVLTHYLLSFGPQEFWLRFPAVLWGTLSVALTSVLARRWLGRRTAIIATALMAFAPIGVQFSQELRPYALYLLFTLISFWSLERGLGPDPGRPPSGKPAMREGGWGHALVFALASVGGALTHYFYAFVLAAQAAFVAGRFIFRKTSWQRFALFTLAAAVGYGALFVAARPAALITLARNFLLALAQIPLGGEFADPSGRGIADPPNLSFFVDGLLPAYGAGSRAAFFLFNGLALVGLITLGLRNRRALATSLLWLLLAPGLVIVYLLYRQEFFANRYVLFALPPYLLVIAHGLVVVARRLPLPRLFLIAGLAALLALDLNQIRLGYRTPKDDWRRVGAFLTANARPGDAVAAPDVQAFVRFYAPAQPGRIVDADDPGPHEQALENSERFWFVWSEYTLIPIEETRQWVRQLPGVTFDLDPRIRVIFIHPGLTPDEMLAEAQTFLVPPPSLR